jgi:flagellar basal-body rod protein FlgC
MRAMEISRSGLEVEWRRLEVIAQNIANINTTRTEGGGPYQAMRLISGPKLDFGTHMAKGAAAPMEGVVIQGLEPAAGGVRSVYEPDHPDANAEGYVSYPAINHAEEMVLMVKTARAYEANLVALNMARQMYSKALDLGKRA